MWGIPLESKSKADSMAAMRILNKLIDQARIPGINKPVFGGKKPSTVFYSDAGNEFRSLRNTPVLKDHKLTIATTSDVKAFFAENAILHIRRKMALIKTHLGRERFAKKGWYEILAKIVETYNITPNKGINYARPKDLLMMDPEALQKVQELRSKTPYNDYFNNKPRERKQIQKYLNQYVRIKLLPTLFQKGSSKEKLSFELFKVTRIRKAHDNYNKSILLHLEDMEGQSLSGVFRVDELLVVQKNSIYHPENENFRPTISNIIRTEKQDRTTYYYVNLAGRLKVY